MGEMSENLFVESEIERLLFYILFFFFLLKVYISIIIICIYVNKKQILRHNIYIIYSTYITIPSFTFYKSIYVIIVLNLCTIIKLLYFIYSFEGAPFKKLWM